MLSLPTSKSLSFPQKAPVLLVTKDKWSLQYTTQINQRTPLVAVKLTIDLGGRYMWVDCENGYFSSSYKPVMCNSAICSASHSTTCATACSHWNTPTPAECLNKTVCEHLPDNRVSFFWSTGDIRQDVVSLQSLTGNDISIADFPFVCSKTSVLENLADGVTGIAGLGRSNISIPAYSSSALGFSNKFAMCLPSSPKSKGVIFLGDGPYPNFPSDRDLLYTPLILNPRSTSAPSFVGEASTDYFVGLKSIKLDGKEIKINKTLLSIAEDGSGGTVLSTVYPYTSLHTSIYRPVLRAFTKKLKNLNPIVPRRPVPFEACYVSTGDEEFARFMPPIDLVFENDVMWRILGQNYVVDIEMNTVCLAFVDGGSEVGRSSVIIGGRQLEDNFFMFDLANSRLGFTSNLPATRNTTCSNYKFKQSI